jgi:nucleoid DNA-binding protein
LVKVSYRKKKEKKNMITKQLINQSYQIVQEDLLNTFTKMKNGDKLRLNNIGVFEKKLKKGQSYLPESYGQKYATYLMGFKMSKVLKRNLNK